MTDFKPGDRVRYTDEIGGSRDPGETGTVTKVEAWGGAHVNWDKGRQSNHPNGERYLELIENPKLTKLFSEPSPFTPEPRPLVGPAPTPPAAPRYIAPFRVGGGFVLDDTGERVLSCEWGAHTYAERVEFARYVATALNARVFTED